MIPAAIVISAFHSPIFAQAPGQTTDPVLLTFDEIKQLYQDADPPEDLRLKLKTLLTTPFVRNTAYDSGAMPLKPNLPGLGKTLRLAQWNIERGLEFDAVRYALSDPKRFNALMEDKASKADEDQRAKIREQIAILQQADVLVLNEVDWGVNRTLFRNVAEELANALNMNYAYGVEFVEVDPLTMGLDQQVVAREVEEAYKEPHDDREGMLARVKQIMTPDPERYHGLHGTAILSRYRLDNVRLLPFLVQGHDWYKDEKKTSPAAKAEGKLSQAVFKEQLIRQVRRGGRMMLMADITDPELPSGRVTVVATHLEDVTSPEMRRKQLNEILDKIDQIDHPVILAGDMNTSTHNGVPISVTRALKQRFGSGKWWAEEGATSAIKYTTPLGWAYDLSLGLVGFARKVDDPTRASIPLIGDNPEAKFFDTIEKFRFDDGSAFDFRGDSEHSANGRGGKLANSNERSEKGFEATEELERRFGPVGRYKLDWIFVRPARLSKPDAHESSAFSCYHGRTLTELNHAIPDRISDHNPITVDLPLAAPGAAQTTIGSN
ncbi:MAG TPA: endonuclease/exonuclease/phosphatase family protein [Bryobacteraceae bacterium]|jgi:endonuclease/exonuclease/phosphatase family metal-dependent hydrolase|nr:endonuclease/exonuclease/phosphatase family protein [Bryobacteraceae bacterium]